MYVLQAIIKVVGDTAEQNCNRKEEASHDNKEQHDKDHSYGDKNHFYPSQDSSSPVTVGSTGAVTSMMQAPSG